MFIMKQRVVAVGSIAVLVTVFAALAYSVYTTHEAKKELEEEKENLSNQLNNLENEKETVEEKLESKVEQFEELNKEKEKLDEKIEEKENEIKEKDKKIKKKDNEIKKLKKPVKKVSSSSTSSSPTSDDNGVESKGTGKIYNAEATHYSAFCSTCGEWGGITASGDDISKSIYVRGKRVIAVDPKVIPLNSKVRVTGGGHDFEAWALDTGGDIKGSGRIDILVESTEEAYRLGRKQVNVEILE